jgi:phospholipid/cholesterol/gamma-HCH transport system substrate-binding protein
VSRALSRLQALILGAVVLLGLGLAAGGLFAVGGKGWYGQDAFHVRAAFRDVGGVEVGTRVRIQGIDAGEVVAIVAPDTPDGPVVLRLRLKGEYRRLVRADSTVQIAGEGMLGGKVLRLMPGHNPSAAPADEDALLAEEPSTELTDVLNQVSNTLKGKGTLGKLANDSEGHDALVGALNQTRDTLATVQRTTESMKKVPLVGRYLDDSPAALLDRPQCQRDRRVFAESDLFEPGRAVLTAQGRRRLDDLAPWLEGMKHTGSEVVVVAYADPKSAVGVGPPATRPGTGLVASGPGPANALTLTREQSKAVCDYLVNHHKVQKMGWFSSRKVTPLGQGVNPPPVPERDALPPARIEIVVFVPQG